jgi:hypothetical protein
MTQMSSYVRDTVHMTRRSESEVSLDSLTCSALLAREKQERAQTAKRLGL